jgi:hypothetical protein
VQKSSGTTVLNQQRAHNHVNEIDTDDTHGDADNPITETTGTAWADPVYDAAGNMTTVPKPLSLANTLTRRDVNSRIPSASRNVLARSGFRRLACFAASSFDWHTPAAPPARHPAAAPCFLARARP